MEKQEELLDAKTENMPRLQQTLPDGACALWVWKKYFERIEKVLSEKADGRPERIKKRKRRKWEKYVQEGGMLWQLLWMSGRVKRSLRDQTAEEAQILAALSKDEWTQMDMLIIKMTSALDQVD